MHGLSTMMKQSSLMTFSISTSTSSVPVSTSYISLFSANLNMLQSLQCQYQHLLHRLQNLFSASATICLDVYISSGFSTSTNCYATRKKGTTGNVAAKDNRWRSNSSLSHSSFQKKCLQWSLDNNGLLTSQ